MSKEEEKILPLGSVVAIKDMEKYMVIMGYSMRVDDDPKIYDYMGCRYPIGAISNDMIMMFDKEIIDKVIFEGYSDEEGENFRMKIKSIGVDE